MSTVSCSVIITKVRQVSSSNLLLTNEVNKSLSGKAQEPKLFTPRGKVCYYRTTSGKEVDFIIEWGRKALAFEVKFTEKPTQKDIKS